MTTELFYLFLTSVLLTVLWIPHIVGQVTTFGPLKREEYRTLRDPGGVPDWVKRANRSHLNLVEQFGAFAGLVVVAHLSDISNDVTAAAAAIFFYARIAHAVVMIAGWGVFMIRTLIFTIAFLCLLAIAWQIAASTLWVG